MEAFDKQQGYKHNDKSCVEFISKDRHSKERLRHGKPRPLPQMSFLNGPKVAKEYPLDRESKQNGKKDAHVCEHHETGIALREIDTCGVEVWPLLEGREDNGRCERGADGTVCRKTHLPGQDGLSRSRVPRVPGTVVPCRFFASARPFPAGLFSRAACWVLKSFVPSN